MATLIPAIGSTAFDSTGERRLAERLEQKLDDDYLLWHNVPIGPKQTHPDFVLLHPKRKTGIYKPFKKPAAKLGTSSPKLAPRS
jgi:hypothetical protein